MADSRRTTRKNFLICLNGLTGLLRGMLSREERVRNIRSELRFDRLGPLVGSLNLVDCSDSMISKVYLCSQASSLAVVWRPLTISFGFRYPILSVVHTHSTVSPSKMNLRMHEIQMEPATWSEQPFFTDDTARFTPPLSICHNLAGEIMCRKKAVSNA